MNGPPLGGFHRTIRKVHRFAQHVEHAPQRLGTHRHRDGAALVGGVHAALQSVRRFHRDGTHPVFTQVLLHFDDDVNGVGAGLSGNTDGVVDGRQIATGEFDVHDGPDDLDDLANLHCCCN